MTWNFREELPVLRTGGAAGVEDENVHDESS
jgi:hypothetical protein